MSSITITVTPRNRNFTVGNENAVFTPPLVVSGSFAMGVNCSGLEDNPSALPGVPNTDYGIPTTAEFDYYRSKGLSLIRLPFLWERMQPSLNSSLNSTYLGYVQTLVNYAGTTGMKVILDCHNFGTYNGVQIGSGSVTEAAFASLWSQLATAFSGNSGLAGYDLMNEPNGLPAGVWPGFAQAGITAVRTADMTAAIYVEGDGYSSAFMWQINNPTLHTLTEPANNLIFSAHQYYDRDNSGSHFDWDTETAAGDQLTSPYTVLDTNIGAKRLAPFINWLQKHGFKGHIGESGVPNTDPNWLTALNNALALVQANKLQFTYWNAGPFSVGYPLGVEPSNGVDTAQMAVLTKYSGAAQPTNCYLTGPARGTEGIASPSFTVSYLGNLSSPVTVTPTDGGNGGTFSPASVTLQPGIFNPSATFTYTATGTATYSIGVTNNASLTNPAPVGYSTASDPFINAAALPVNIFSLRRIYTPYIGPAVLLRRSSDNAQASFNYLANGNLDTASISSWAGASNVYIVTWYDQSPNGNNAGPPNSTDNSDGPGGGSALPASNSDQPQLILSGGANGKAYINWNTNRMDAVSPINGNTAQTILSVFKPSNDTQSYLAAWTETQNYQFPGNGLWNVQGEQPINMGLDSTQWHTYYGRYSCGAENGVQTFLDGELLAESDSTQSSIDFEYRDVVNLGYFKFYPSYLTGALEELIIFNGALANSDIAAFQASQEAYFSTPNPSVGNVTGLTLGSVTATTAALSWTAASGVTAYTILYRPHNSTLWNTAGGVSGTSTTLTGLFSNEQLDFVVYGTNGSAVGGLSNTVTATMPAQTAGSAPKIPYVGVNLSGGENSTPIWPTNAQIAYYAGKGCNVIRLPIKWENAQPSLNGALSSGYMASVDAIVAYAATLSVSVVIDLHNYGSYNSTQIGTSPVTNSAFANIWQQIATRYLSNANVIFGLMNEPAQSSASGWQASVQAAVTAIRGTGATQLILVQGCQGDHAWQFTNDGSAAQIQNSLVDSANNFAVEVHQYFDSDGSGTHPTVISATIAAEYMAATICWARLAGIKLWLGEFGAGNGDQAIQCLNNLAASLATNSDVFEGVTIWGGGDFESSLEPGGYPLGIEPFNGADTPQLLTVLNLVPGGAFYGQKPPVNAFPLTLNGVTFGSATWGGQSMTGGWGLAATNPNQGLINVTLAARVTLSAGLTLTTNYYALGCDSIAALGVNSSGQVICGGLTSSASIKDGNPHYIEYGCNGTHSYLFIDGTLVASEASSPISLSSPSPGYTTDVGNYKGFLGTTNEWPGTIEYAELRGNCAHTANYTPPSSLPGPGIPYMVAQWQLQGNGNGLE